MAEHMKKILLMTILAGIATLCVVNSVSAGPAWIDGVVTSEPREGRVRHLGVNEIDYSLMQQVRFTRRYQVREGAWQDKEISFSDIRFGAKVEILREGFRIYEIVVIEQR